MRGDRAASRAALKDGARDTADPGERWRDLQVAVREAVERGAEFRVVGDQIEITGDIPDELRSRLPKDLLWIWLGAEKADLAEQHFAAQQGIEPILIEQQF